MTVIGYVTKLEITFPVYDYETGKCWWQVSWAAVRVDGPELVQKAATVRGESKKLLHALHALHAARKEYAQVKAALTKQGYRF